MRRITQPSVEGKCLKCGGPIPATKRSDASYCSVRCCNAAEKARLIARNPEYRMRQRRKVAEIRHLHTHGHIHFIDNPSGNPKDRFREARVLGYRSMLEVQVARQIEEVLGIDPKTIYEKTTINYVIPINQ